MKLFRTDKLYEDAARTAEDSDTLLRRLRRSRRNSCIIFGALCLLVLLFCAWGLVLASQWFRNPSQELPALLSKDLWAFALLILGIGLMEFVWMVSYDTQIKMLLFLRNQTNRPDAETCPTTV